jgi:iron complex outermembrane receptor protein
MGRKFSLGVSLVALAATLFAAPSIAQDAQGGAQEAQAQRRYDIPAGDLGAALRTFGEQSDANVLVDPALVQGKQSAGLHGVLSRDAALAALLQGSGLGYHLEGGAIVIGAGATPLPSQHSDAGSTPSSDAEAGAGATPDILVVGNRTLNADIRRTEDDIQPYVVITREAIEHSGAANLEGVLRSLLPMHSGAVSASQQNSVTGTASSINLRGLGSDQTLILVDGRRVPGLSFNGASTQPDVNGIALSSIERIEVLPTTASGIYGGGATGGVINIILRRDYSGLEGLVTLGDAFQQDRSEFRGELRGGYSFDNAQTSLTFSASRSQSGDLLTEDRNFLADGRRRILDNDASAVLDSFFPPLGATTNIRDVAGGNLNLKPSFGGGALGSPFTSVPYNYGGPASDNGAGLIASAGRYNLDLADTAQSGGGGLRSLLNTPTITSGDLALRHTFTPWLDGLFEVSASRTESRFADAPASSSYFLSASDPGNPFTSDVEVTVPLLGADTVSRSTNDEVRLLAVATFDLPMQWRGDLEDSLSRVTFSSRSAESSLNFAEAGQISSGAINVFADVNTTGVDFSPFLLPAVRYGPGDTTLNAASLRLSGPLGFSFPGGSPTLSLLLERRDEQLGEFTVQQNGFAATFYRRSQTSQSAYAEIAAPLVSPANGVPGINALDLQLAVRVDNYLIHSANRSFDFDPQPRTQVDNEFTSTNPTIGLRWAPIGDVTLRASYGTGFLPPRVDFLVPDAPQTFPGFFLGVTDTERGGETLGTIDFISGGNPELRPEHSESVAIGVVVTPRFLSGFRLSADWTSIDKTDNIQPALFVTPQENFDQALIYAPQRFIRSTDPSTFGPFGVGPIIGIDATAINIARAHVEAVDFELDQDWRLDDGASLNFSGRATYAISQTQQLTPVAPVVDFVGLGDTPDWRANGSLTWERGPFTIAWSIDFIDSYRVAPSVAQAQGANSVPAQFYHNLYVGYRIPRGEGGLLSDTELRIDLRNIFNEAPPFQASLGNSDALYSGWGDPRMARYAISLRKAF